ncbi:MAG: Rpn family recombination-promoting nuclease/putative transposase [Deltaproteobacteria bacterium]|nr:Rpn family recombination-promoting nuclease/putative transposase [Deltaproteobacteria bacterium]
MSNPHDSLFKSIFCDPAEVAGLLRDLLHGDVLDQLNLDELVALPAESIDEILSSSSSDLRFRVPWRGGGHVELVLILEHQSTPDRTMPLRVLRYTLRVWEAAMAASRSARLPVVLTLVVHHGRRPWSAPTRLSEMYDAPPSVIAALGDHLPELRLFLEDLTRLPDAEIPAEDGGRLTLLLMRHAHDPELWPILKGNLRLLDALLNRRGELPTFQLLRYVFERSDSPPDDETLAALERRLRPAVKEELMRYGDRLRSEGQAEGLRIAVETLLQERFGGLPPWALARLQELHPENLQRLIREALTAPDLNTLLRPEAG